jgi:hypothetical protein
LISLLLSGERASKAEPKPAIIARPVCIETRRAPVSDLLITINPQRIERQQQLIRCGVPARKLLAQRPLETERELRLAHGQSANTLIITALGNTAANLILLIGNLLALFVLLLYHIGCFLVKKRVCGACPAHIASSTRIIIFFATIS